MIIAQSTESWYSPEFQAACLEAKYEVESRGLRYRDEDKRRYIEEKVRSVSRFDAECRILKKDGKERDFPIWQTIVKWEKQTPNLINEVRQKGVFRGLQAQQFAGSGYVSTAAYPPQSHSYVGNDIVRQVCGTACEVAVLAFVGLCMGQYAKVAAS